MDLPYANIQSPQGSRQIPLGAQPISIGRLSDNVVVVTDPQASRHHCVVEPVPQGFVVRDLGSRNGTIINQRPVKEALLCHGDVLTIGKTQIRFVLTEGAGEEVDDGEFLDELDEVEEITEDDEYIPVADEANEESGGDPSDPQSNPRRILIKLAESLPDKTFSENNIILLNARGQTAHGAYSEDNREVSDQSRDTVTLLRLILLVCFRLRSSDVHVEPKNQDYQVRIRVDGNLVDVLRLNRETGIRITSLVKILSDIDIAQKNIVQEGHFSCRVPNRRVDYRVSFAPAIFGQKLVIRVFDTANTPLHLWDLQLPQWMYDSMERTIQQDAGMMLVCGPTGSGKTTTLYALLRSIDVGQRNVVTIEDPVEIQLEGVTQIPVNEAQGNTFSTLLRSVLRQDPDALLVGEIRDPETARIAMQAAITGHLVFSTVHSRDSIGTIFRLLDLGVEPYMVAQGLHLILSQRLIRLLCPFCRQPSRLTEEIVQRMGPAAQNVKQIYRPAGCPRCLSTGYAGRRAVFELLTTTDELRDLIMRRPTSHEIHEALAKTKFQRLLHSGYQLVAEGMTSLDEVDRAIGAERALG